MDGACPYPEPLGGGDSAVRHVQAVATKTELTPPEGREEEKPEVHVGHSQ